MTQRREPKPGGSPPDKIVINLIYTDQAGWSYERVSHRFQFLCKGKSAGAYNRWRVHSIEAPQSALVLPAAKGNQPSLQRVLRRALAKELGKDEGEIIGLTRDKIAGLAEEE